jgi:hypothetical protein
MVTRSPVRGQIFAFGLPPLLTLPQPPSGTPSILADIDIPELASKTNEEALSKPQSLETWHSYTVSGTADGTTSLGPLKSIVTLFLNHLLGNPGISFSKLQSIVNVDPGKTHISSPILIFGPGLKPVPLSIIGTTIKRYK